MPEAVSWRASPFEGPEEALLSETLPRSLARAVERWPERVAVRHDGVGYTFSDLARRVAGLAEEIARARAPHGPVALLQSAGLDAVAAWFSCALAGRPLLLLEPGHPPARLKELITAAAAALVVCDPATLPSLPADLPTERLLPRGDLLPWRSSSSLAPDDPAMIFPTSGSTGTPKLVTYSSRTLQVKVQSSIKLMRVPDGASVLIAGSHGNYGFLHHALVFMLSGGTLCLADVREDGLGSVIRAITRDGARHARFTPSLFRAIARQPEAREALRCLDAVRFSGEPLLRSDLELALGLLRPECLIQNVYGSTESSLFIWSRGDELDASAGTVPIGHIYPHSSYALRPLAEGTRESEVGELVLRSAFHALGDFSPRGIDGSRFPRDENSPSERVYETGDIVHRLLDGSLVMLGRSSRMVKVRGQRVFLTEVENYLRATPGVTGAAAATIVEGDDTVIYAFVTVGPVVLNPRGIRRSLADRLPDFMLPRDIFVVDAIPVLPGGKLDYESLIERVPAHSPAPDVPDRPQGEHGRLAALWLSIMGPGARDPGADFFALGGDSLKLMQLTLAVEREFGRPIPREVFLADPTLDGLAVALGLPRQRSAPSAKGGLTLRPVRDALGNSRGVALAMPGWHGSAVVAPFCQAGLFPDHEIWAADLSLGRGNLVERHRWWHAAQEIAARIKTSEAPAPRILFGYSIGGSIAWIVSRLLAGTPSAPEFVVMVDAAPVHRLRAKGVPETRRLITAMGVGASPAVLHIRRAPVEPGAGARDWLPAENVLSTLDMPTVDHLEMGEVEVLRQAMSWLTDALGSTPIVKTTCVRASKVNTVGGAVYRAMVGGDRLGSAELGELARKFFTGIGGGSSQLLLCLMLRDGTPDEARDFIERALKTQPGSRALHYARRRLRRTPEALCRSFSLPMSPRSLRGIDAALYMRRNVTLNARPTSRAWQIVDILGAIADAAPARLVEVAQRARALIGFRRSP